jgi:hypothetical protein
VERCEVGVKAAQLPYGADLDHGRTAAYN